MKRQTGFISSSSSVTITYATRTGSKLVEYSDVVRTVTKTEVDVRDGESYSVKLAPNNTTKDMNLYWRTYESSSYQRIESFLEAVEKLNTPYSKTAKTYFKVNTYTNYTTLRNIYNGFVDIVITFPCRIRLAGIELLNPWINSFTNDVESTNWKFLPSVFSIFKVNDDQKNAKLQNYTYENDIIKDADYSEKKLYFRPVKYDDVESDERMTFLGRYEVNWETTPSYKCFFKFNKNDRASVNIENSSSSAGTATWECKQLVLRIFQTNMSKKTIDKDELKRRISEYIVDKEIEYGTLFNGRQPIVDDVLASFGKFTTIEPIFKNCDGFSDAWEFGSYSKRSYVHANDVCFSAGIEYKLGGIQLLLSPDIFCISEMKMYNYCNTMNNKVFVGEWDKNLQMLEYYGAGTLRTSDYIDISNVKANAVTWKHNFNVPPKYLDAKVYVRFRVDFDTFYAGDVVSNLVNADKEPLTMRITGTDVTLNISNGICFTNPQTGEFMQFKHGFGIQHDREGNYDALKAAQAVGAHVLSAKSIVASKIEAIDKTKGNAYPFEIYFVVKRLF